MTVAELIEALKAMPQDAVACFNSGYPEEVTAVELGQPEAEIMMRSGDDDGFSAGHAHVVIL